MSLKWLFDNFEILFGLCVVWIVFWIVVSAISRKKHGRGIKDPPKHEVIFEERAASGRSLKSWYTSWGGAQNCLLVTVTDAKLLIRPFFPFTLLFLPEIFDLEHELDLNEIVHVSKEKAFLKDKVLVEFRKQGRKALIELRLRDADAFIQAATT